VTRSINHISHKTGLLDRIFDSVVLPAPEINRKKLVDRIFGYIAISIGA